MKPDDARTRQLAIFFALAFLIGWLAFIPGLLFGFSPKPGAFIFLFSPAAAALITAFLTNGTAGIREVLRRYCLWRFGLRWYALALLLLPCIFLLAVLSSFRTDLAALWTGSPWYFLVASFVYLLIINSGEEIGWRGFALPRLQRLLKSPLLSAIGLGVIWGLWHLPIYLDPQQSGFPLMLFLLFIVGLSICYSVLFNNTRGSLFMAVLLHASTDFAPRVLRIANFTPASWSIIVALTWISAMILWFLTRNTPAVEAIAGSPERESQD